MALATLNLIDSQFQKSNLFSCLPVFDAIYYEGHPQGAIQRYRAVREDQECLLLASSIIREEEKILWEATEDLLERSTYEAASRMQGVFIFDLLTFDVHRAKNTFNFSEFALMIAHASRKILPGEQRLVAYDQAFGLLQCLGKESWGKITFKTSVDVVKDSANLFYLTVERLFKLAAFPRCPLIVLVNDISAHPFYDANNARQQELFAQAIEKQSQQSIEFLPEVYIQDCRGVRELFSGTSVRRL